MANRQFGFDCYGRIEDINNGIKRKDIFVSKTSQVDLEEYDNMKYGLQRILIETSSKLGVIDYGSFNNTTRLDYTSPDWYQNKCLTDKDTGLGRQVSARRLADLLNNEPYQETVRGGTPHYDFMVLDKDLTFDDNDNMNYIFGYGPYPLNIISTKRFAEYIKDKTLRLLCLGVVAAHEFGHNLNLVRRNFNVGTEGLHAGHCMGESGPCLMEQVNSGGKSIQQVTKEIINRSNWLCRDCSEELQFKKRHLANYSEVF